LAVDLIEIKSRYEAEVSSIDVGNTGSLGLE
jgi:hypothetical protein